MHKYEIVLAIVCMDLSRLGCLIIIVVPVLIERIKNTVTYGRAAL
jgi:hypothetical protein